jgi:hypothetical protein
MKYYFFLINLLFLSASPLFSDQSITVKSSDKFPNDIEGTKLVGIFRAIKSFDNTFFLVADTDYGEKDVQRQFYVINSKSLESGASYEFTESNPAIIQSKVSFLGGYNIYVPKNIIRKDVQVAFKNARENDQYYRPSDEFPNPPVGLKVIGKFCLEGPPNEEPYLVADSKRGEKNNGRLFLIINSRSLTYPYDNLNNFKKGHEFTFAEDFPLIITRKSGLAAYQARFPNNYVSPSMIATQVKEKENTINREMIERNILEPLKDLYMSHRNKDNLSNNASLNPDLNSSKGFALFPWGSSFQDVILKSDIESDKLYTLFDYEYTVRDLEINCSKYTDKHQRLVNKLLPFNDILNGAGIFLSSGLRPLNLDTHYRENANIIFETIGLKLVHPISVVKGISKNKIYTYVFAARKLYSIIIEPISEPKMNANTADVLNDSSNNFDYDIYNKAFEIKYGSPKVEVKHIDGLEYIFKSWSNSSDSIVMVIKPRKGDAELEFRKFLTSAIQEDFKNKHGFDQAILEHQGEDFGRAISNLPANIINMYNEAFKSAEKQLLICGIYYYSSEIMKTSEQMQELHNQQIENYKKNAEVEEMNNIYKSAQDLINNI